MTAAGAVIKSGAVLVKNLLKSATLPTDPKSGLCLW